MPRAKKPKLGRPPDGDHAATERVEVRLTPAQRKEWEQAAAKENSTLKAWLVAAAELALSRGSTR